MIRILAARAGAACALALLPTGAMAQIDAIGGERLEVEIRIADGKAAAFKGAEPIAIEFVLRNPASQPVQVLVWRTPFGKGGITDNIFDVALGRTGPATSGAGAVSYIGPIVKRGPPQPEDFITLAPGQSQTATVNLAQYYAIYQQGDYSVSYRTLPTSAPAVQSAPSAAPQPLRKIAARGNALTFSVTEARQPAPKPAPSMPITAAGTSFDGCSSTQQTQLNAAIPEATRIAAEAAKILRDTPSSDRPAAVRYKTWFGTFSEARYARATRNFEKIESAFRTKQIEIACNGSQCSAGTFAYVFPTEPYKIYVCGAFWSANITGTDSRSGTLVHEMSHFDIVAGTDDDAYGQEAARQLAIDAPNTAVDNADNHEYFAENTPNQPM
jgi:peptidyl-Lys metalloendopeptidase